MRIFVLTGPTGVGKTMVAVALARKYHLEIISADSRQIYRYFDIGTAKPSLPLRQEIAFHLIDFLEPNQSYSAAEFARDAKLIMKRLSEQGKRFIIVGGSNFYLRALFRPLFNLPKSDPAIRLQLTAVPIVQLYERLKMLDPQRAAQLHCNDRYRIVRALEIYELTGKTFSQLAKAREQKAEYLPVYAVLTMSRVRLYQQINERFDQMMASGLLEEVRQLKERGFGPDSPAAQGYGYRELFNYLDGKYDLTTAIMIAKRKTREFAKRQLTWLGSLSGANWFEMTTVDEVVQQVAGLLLDVLPNSN